jgi:restriction system protein
MGFIVLMFVVVIVLGVIAGLMQPKKKKRGSLNRKKKYKIRKQDTATIFIRTALTCRPDSEILTSPLNEITGPEFERLLALYFRDQGYTVKEVGVGGNDGGVDLVIIDRRGEKTAVQAKCYADHNLVPVQTVRELVAAKRNHDCILSMIITTSDLTFPAKKEAEKFRIEYWHGGFLEQKLKSWSRWQPRNANKKKA